MSVFFACFISRFMGSKLEFVLDTGVSLYRGSLRYAVCGSWKKSLISKFVQYAAFWLVAIQKKHKNRHGRLNVMFKIGSSLSEVRISQGPKCSPLSVRTHGLKVLVCQGEINLWSWGFQDQSIFPLKSQKKCLVCIGWIIFVLN